MNTGAGKTNFVHGAFPPALNAQDSSAPRESEARLSLSNGRKGRTDQIPRLLQMPPAQQQALKEWLTIEGASYALCGKRLLEKFGVKTNRTSLYEFFRNYCVAAEAATDQAKPLVEISIVAAAVNVRIAVLPSGEVITTKGDAA